MRHVIVVAIALAGALQAGCTRHFEKATNGFRTVGLGMSRAQVQARLQADSRFALFNPASRMDKSRIMAFTTIGKYDAAVDFCFGGGDVLTSIRISVGEAGRRYPGNHIQYFYNVLRTKFGPPAVSSDKINGLDIYTWDGANARRTLFVVKYRISVGQYLVVFISDPKELSEEETEMRKSEGVDKSFFRFPKLPEERVLSDDF
jgi:hypothetical protein